MWTSLTSYRSISRHIDRMFRIRFVLFRRSEFLALLTGLPRTRVAINVVGIAQRKAFVLNLTTPATSKRHKGGIAAYPLLATRRLHWDRLREPNWRLTLLTRRSMPSNNANHLLSYCFAAT